MSAANISMNMIGHSNTNQNAMLNHQPSLLIDATQQSSYSPVAVNSSINHKNENITEIQSQIQLSQVSKTISKINQQLQYVQEGLHFKVHKASGQLIVEVENLKTGEIIKTFPPERLLDLFGKIRSAVGALVDKEG